jgi:hypothetical protein
MECPPTESVEVVNVATPADIDAGGPNGVVPSVKVTVPVAVAGDTLAVKMTAWLNCDGFNEEVNVTIGMTLTTVCTTGVEMAAVSVASPLYAAVTECVPTERLEVVSAAAPPRVRVTGLPKGVVPSRNVTVPVAEAGVTVAANVTACPAFEGLTEDVSPTAAVTLLTTCTTGVDVLEAVLTSPL